VVLYRLDTPTAVALMTEMTRRNNNDNKDHEFQFLFVIFISEWFFTLLKHYYGSPGWETPIPFSDIIIISAWKATAVC
jgi:hypothetical protein